MRGLWEALEWKPDTCQGNQNSTGHARNNSWGSKSLEFFRTHTSLHIYGCLAYIILITLTNCLRLRLHYYVPEMITTDLWASYDGVALGLIRNKSHMFVIDFILSRTPGQASIWARKTKISWANYERFMRGSWVGDPTTSEEIKNP